MDYDLNRLGEREFEHLTQALALKTLGPAVGVFGDGSDGGREASFSGRVPMPEPRSHEAWDGYGVIQAKFHYRPRGTKEGAQWLKAQLKTELDTWLDSSSKRGKPPEYFIATSNVVLSPTSETGGIDSVNDLIADYAPKLGLKGWDVWHYDKLCRMLDDASNIVRRYFGLIAPGDVLARLNDYVIGLDQQLGTVLTGHVVKELLVERSVRLGQAGDADNRGLSLNRVAVDLPASWGQNTSSVPTAAEVIAHADTLRRPSDGGEGAGGLVIRGGPGQGKTTLAQLICQTYRVALAAGLPDEWLPEQARTLCAEFQGEALGEIGLTLPAVRRWPVHVRLAQYSDRIASDRNLTLLRYIAEQVTARAPGTVTEKQLSDWLAQWPWLVVLDGLDEVADQPTRERVLHDIDDLWVDAHQRDADLMVVVTTRAQSYGEEFAREQYTYLDLLPLEPDTAIHYAERLTAARYGSEFDRQEQVVERVRTAATDERAARLMHTPLQVTIMSLLLDRRPQAPQHHYGLFRDYYTIVFTREVDKQTVETKLLDRHATHVHTLQERAGLLLQVRSEGQGGADATLSQAELRELATSLLREEGYEADTADDLSGKLVTSAMRRLVLLVPVSENAVGFEVRSLQEFMAARALVSGADTDILANLASLAPAIHWRDTWLLAAGKLFAERGHLRGELLNQLQAVDFVDHLHRSTAAGASLAVELLAEGIADTAPAFQALLAKYAVELLRRPPDRHLLRLADVLADAMAHSPQVSAVVEPAIVDALTSANLAGVSAMMLCAVWAGGTGTFPGQARGWLNQARNNLQTLGGDRWAAAVTLAVNYPLSTLRDLAMAPTHPQEPLDLTAMLRPYLTAEDLSDEEHMLAERAIDVFTKAELWWERADGVWVVRADRAAVTDLSQLDECLASPRVAAALVRMMDGIDLARWPVAALLRRALSAWRAHQPVAHRMVTPPVTGHGW